MVQLVGVSFHRWCSWGGEPGVVLAVVIKEGACSSEVVASHYVQYSVAVFGGLGVAVRSYELFDGVEVQRAVMFILGGVGVLEKTGFIAY